jgi:hypothetical protein
VFRQSELHDYHATKLHNKKKTFSMHPLIILLSFMTSNTRIF